MYCRYFIFAGNVFPLFFITDCSEITIKIKKKKLRRVILMDSSEEDGIITHPITTQNEPTTAESNNIAEATTAENNNATELTTAENNNARDKKKAAEKANITLSASNSTDCSGIHIMRAGDDVTKLYPCGYCTETTWWTKPRDHFRASHFDDANVAKTIELADFELDDDTSDEDRKNAIEERLALGHLILNTSSFLHNERVLTTGAGQCYINYGPYKSLFLSDK